MNYYGKKSLSNTIKVVLDIVTLLGAILAVIILYQGVYSKGIDVSTPTKILIIALLIIGIGSLFSIIFDIRKILTSLVNKDPFTIDNVNNLKRMSWKCYVISGTYILNMIFNINLRNFKLIYLDSTGIHTDMEFIIFLFAGCFLYILSKVFNQAVNYKEENDSTI